MSEIIFLQIGQCGNQIGWKFWEKALTEHQKHYQDASYDLSYKSFFEVGEKGSFATLNKVRARALLIDTETNAAKQLQNSKIGSIFQGCNISFDASGAGNNWAYGYKYHGQNLGGEVFEKIRKLAERTDHLESFFMLYSLGGGTGSGFGSYILEHLADDFPKQWKMNVVVTPNEDDAFVITAPFNCALATSHLCQFSDCVFPVENASLQNYVHGVEQGSTGAFDQMNAVVANFMLDLTAGSRFSGKMNVDLREIETNMIPFPNHKFLCSGISPILPESAPRSITGYFTEAMSSKATLCELDPHSGTYLANALLVRGDVTLSSVRASIDKVSSKISFPPWSKEGWKIGLCSNPPLYSKHSVLCLTNTTAMSQMFRNQIDRFNKLYKAKAFIQHYTKYGVEEADITSAVNVLEFAENEYEDLKAESIIPERPKILV